MSGGAIAQLVSRGEQDKYITGSPDITFFNSNYKRHSNFSMFTQQQSFEGSVLAGRVSRVKFTKNGDLLGSMNLVVKENGQTVLVQDWTKIIEYAELIIGGQVIDKQDSTFSEYLAVDLLANSYSKSYPASLHGGLGSKSFFYPFRFFFCEMWQSALPLVALNYHDVELKIKWSEHLPSNQQCFLTSTYILLDDQERNSIALKEHNMLIYQVQKNPPSNERVHELVFNHPVKFIASSNAVANNLVSRVNQVKIQVNGTDIEDYRNSIPYYSAIPCYYNTEFAALTSEGIFFYPFCLVANKYQPTGTLNFSRIDSCTLHCTEPINQPIYAVNYNVLKIKNGMAGVLFAD